MRTEEAMKVAKVPKNCDGLTPRVSDTKVKKTSGRPLTIMLSQMKIENNLRRYCFNLGIN